MIRPALRRGLAEKAVARHGVSVALACRTFGVSETCYRYSPLLSDENEEIADLLVGLTAARKTWGFGLCFLHLRNVQGHPWNHKRVYPTGRQVIVCNHRQADLLRTGAEPTDQAQEAPQAGQT